jgi:hypothetical protein
MTFSSSKNKWRVILRIKAYRFIHWISQSKQIAGNGILAKFSSEMVRFIVEFKPDLARGGLGSR